MPVVRDVLFGLVLIASLVVVDFSQRFEANWNRILAHVNAREFPYFDLLVPRVVSYLGDTETIVRFGTQYRPNQVLTRLTDEVRDVKLGIQYLLV